ncbi:GNAT family N-acetyltransferase [Pedobacter sp. PAMC26386]|nr:GNAT family N-acetyltransferase [Pedobacter sp. PAMC26386]
MLRAFAVSDALNFYYLNLDPEVIKYTGDKPFDSIEKTEDFLRHYDHYLQYGFGRWAVIKKSNEEFLGWCGLKYTDASEEYDIGFRFFKRNWNHGYATEAAKACVALGFERFGMERIVGRAMKKNTGSIRVLKKLGFTFLKEFNFDGEEGVIYKLDQREFDLQDK